MMNTIPEPILMAALKVLHVAAYTTRNWTLSEEISRKQINALWEALHEIPGLVTCWHPDAEAELLAYLRKYDEKWDNPRLTEIYNQELNRQ